MLLALLIFNMIGFSIYSLLNTNCIDQLSSATNNTDIILKMPFSLPYVTDWQGAESVEGELLHGDDFYNIMSRKVANDTLYVQCEFNESARDRFWGLVSSFDEHIKSTGNSKNHSADIMKNILKEYMSTERRLTFFIFEWITPGTYPDIEVNLLTSASNIFIPPPNFS